MSLTNLLPVIAKIQSQPNWQDRRRFLQIINLWHEIVGASVANQTRPTGIYRQVLQVAVSSSAWSQALVFERLRILSKLQPLLTAGMEPITDIHFSTAKWHSLKASVELQTESLKSIPEMLLQHPSYIAPKTLKSTQLPLPPSTALEAFQRLSAIVKTQTATMPKCPRCRCATPLGELRRWEMCSTCVRVGF
jgi:predicted nucleic acid-binding Zn ribbon protein